MLFWRCSDGSVWCCLLQTIKYGTCLRVGMVTPQDHLDENPNKSLSKQEAKEQLLYGIEQSYPNVDVNNVTFHDDPAPSHSNADGQVTVDIPDRPTSDSLEYYQ